MREIPIHSGLAMLRRASRSLVALTRRTVPVALTLLLALSAVPAFAQETTGSIVGKIVDQTGAVVPGARVELSNEQRSQDVTSDSGGGYQFLNVQPGRYKLTVSASGFGTKVRPDVVVELGRTISANLELAPTVGEQVTVTTSDEPLVDISSTKTATNITQEEFNLIPKTLNFASIINVAPGARQEDKSAGYQIDGASGSENVFVLDGVEVTRIEDGQLGQGKNIPFDFVREVQVKSAGYEAEFGGATGGVINVVTRSGANQFHGEARFEFENSALRAMDNPQLRLNPLNTNAAEYVLNPQGKDDDHLYSPVFSLSGPIVKDKLFFYASYAPQLFTTNQQLDLTENTGTAINTLDSRFIETKTKYDYSFARIDYNPFDKLTTNLSFIRSPYKQEGAYPAVSNYRTGSLATFENPIYSSQGGYSQQWQLAGGANYALTDSLVLSFRGGTTFLNDKNGNYGLPTSTPYIAIQNPCSPQPGLPCLPGTTNTGAVTINNFQTLYNVTRRNNYYVDATYLRRIGGQQHTFKGGFQLNQLSNKVDEGYPAGRVLPYFGSSILGQRGDYGYYRIDRFGTQGDVSSSNKSLFIQDSWQVHPRVTLNLGLRVESEYLPTYPINAEFHPTLNPDDLSRAESKPISFGWGDKVAPRLGVAWDVFGDQRLKVFGSYSVFFDTMKYALARGSFGGDIYIIERYTLDTPDIFSINLNNKPGDLILTQDARVPSSLTPLPGEQPGIDPDLKPTKEHEFTVGGEYAFSTNWLAAVRFTRKELDRTIEDVGRHDIDGNEIYTIGNPGFGATQDTTFFSFPAPKAVRNYTGLEFRLDKRYSNNWYANLTYLYSRLYGNYSGLAATDELNANGVGRTDPNVNRYWDFPTLLFDANGNETLGRLPTDRPNTFKAYAGYTFNWAGNQSTDVSGTQLIYQGTPITTRIGFLSADHIVAGRADLGRTPVFTQSDLLVTHRWRVNERVSLKFTLNVLNLWDERNESVHYELYAKPGNEITTPCQPGDACFPNQAYQEYFSLGAQGAFSQFSGSQLDPRYNLTNVFQTPRRARIGFGVEF